MGWAAGGAFQGTALTLSMVACHPADLTESPCLDWTEAAAEVSQVDLTWGEGVL